MCAALAAVITSLSGGWIGWLAWPASWGGGGRPMRATGWGEGLGQHQSFLLCVLTVCGTDNDKVGMGVVGGIRNWRWEEGEG